MWPSPEKPFTAMNIVPGTTFRESLVRPLTSIVRSPFVVTVPQFFMIFSSFILFQLYCYASAFGKSCPCCRALAYHVPDSGVDAFISVIFYCIYRVHQS